MTRVLVAIALLAPSAAGEMSAPPRQLCMPAPPRIVPRSHFERVDKWRDDERTIA